MCLSDEEKKMKWSCMIADYNEAMNVLREKDMTHAEEELRTFQCKIDSFANLAATMCGKQMFTNHVHDLISGHILECMNEWGCLCRHF